MKIIDWYILKKYLTTFFVLSCCAYSNCYCGIDLSERADDFAKAKLTTSQIITGYFGFTKN